MKSVTHFSVLLIIAVQLFTAGKCLVEPRQDAAVFSEADLASLRTLMDQENIDAYIVPSGDAHYSEFIAPCHQRRAFISGFTGSAGTAIVTKNEALLWTDGRYFLQAEQELDPKLWKLMRDGLPGVPSQSQWLKENLAAGMRVGVDPTLYSKRQWDSMSMELTAAQKTLEAISDNLIDVVWLGRQPLCGKDNVFNLGNEFSGRSTTEKLSKVRSEMKDNGASVLVVTELDEVAWLLNVRGKDIPNSSTFFAFLVITEGEFHLFINQNQLPQDVKTVLKMNVPEFLDHGYGELITVLLPIVGQATGKVWFNQNTNYDIVRNIIEEKRLMQITPIALMKATKNPTEVVGYRKALIRDAAALCEFFQWLETEMKIGATITEISAAEKLHQFRALRQNFAGDSFTTISAAGPNAALPHYMPTNRTNARILRNNVYLLDSGGLYYDGTTDITRTVHFGTPTAHQKNCYTRVLKGQIALALAIFPHRTTGQRLDSFARQFLWEAGLDYNHGTGHGIGSFLNVHEGPFSIGSGYNSLDPGLRENFITSNEPGYYEDNSFGIRLENLIRVKNVSLENNFQNRGYLGFEDMTFVPYDHNLIQVSILTEDEINYLNNYQENIRKYVGGYMTENNMSYAAYQWMLKATVPVKAEEEKSSTTTPATRPTSPTSSTTPASSTPAAAASGVKFEVAILFLTLTIHFVALQR